MELTEPLLTTEDVAKYLQVEVVTVRRLVNRGELGAYRIGGEYRFANRDVAEYLERQHIPVKQDAVRTDGSYLDWIESIGCRKLLTKRAQRALQLAAEEARSFKCSYIGPEHLLLGLIREDEGIAGKVLHDVGVYLPQARGALEFIGGVGSAPASRDDLNLGEDGKQALEAAFAEARRLNHRFLGTEHLLLGLLCNEASHAARMLEIMGVSLEQVRTQVLELLRSK